MALLRSVVLRNYRRFAGEVELNLAPGLNLVHGPPGMGKSTIVEAVAWCLLGPEALPAGTEVRSAGVADEAMVSLSFFAEDEPTLVRTERGPQALRRGKADPRPFSQAREALFPAHCVPSNLISGTVLQRFLQGSPSGTERAVGTDRGWWGRDAAFRSSMEATCLFLSLVPDSAAVCLDFDPQGRPGVQLSRADPLTPEERYLATLASILGFARESCPDAPLLLDEPFLGLRRDRARAVEATIDFLAGRQCVLLLSDPEDVGTVRERADRELEVRG